MLTQLIGVITTHLRQMSLYNAASISRRLVGQEAKSCNTFGRKRFHSPVDFFPMTDHQLLEAKPELVPFQTFVFFGMEFLTRENIVRVPLDRVQL